MAVSINSTRQQDGDFVSWRGRATGMRIRRRVTVDGFKTAGGLCRG